MKSAWNKILRVDLSNGTCKPEELADDLYEKFLGGAGMSAYVLWRESPRGTTAFDPANRLTFAPGPMQGLKQTGAAKWTAGAISPALGEVSVNCSNFADCAWAEWGARARKRRQRPRTSPARWRLSEVGRWAMGSLQHGVR